jgi:hypothetical protein
MKISIKEGQSQSSMTIEPMRVVWTNLLHNEERDMRVGDILNPKPSNCPHTHAFKNLG